MKVNVITMHRAINYGAVLQTYATVKYLENMGYEVEIIDYIPKRFRTKNKLLFVNPRRNKSIFHRIAFITACFPGRLAHDYIFGSFIKRNFKLTSASYYNIDDLRINIPQADIYITGSDQVWNTDIEKRVDEAFFLDFVPKGKKRIAYAASFGKDSLNDEETEKIKQLINKYDNISVREDSGLKILKSLGRDDTKHVMDPALLLTKEQWEEKSTPRLIKEKYVLIYQLNPSDKLIKYANEIAKAKNLRVAKFGWDYIKPNGVDINLYYKKPEDFLSAVKYADFIVTDSFHGIVFSLNFNKLFICVAPPKYSGRLESILRETNLENRLIKESFDINSILREIDYTKINEHFNNSRNEAKQYLENALK